MRRVGRDQQDTAALPARRERDRRGAGRLADAALAAEKEDLRLVPYSLVYRMSYILLIDICKVLATFEELAGVRMGWGKLERLGRLST